MSIEMDGSMDARFTIDDLKKSICSPDSEYELQLARQLVATMQREAVMATVLRECQGYILEVGQHNGEWEMELLGSIDEVLEDASDNPTTAPDGQEER